MICGTNQWTGFYMITAAVMKELKEGTFERRKDVFISFQKLFSYLRFSSFRTLGSSISWRHQMPKYETRNTFYWITCEVNTVWSWSMTSLCHITKDIFLSKNSTKILAGKLFRVLCYFQRMLGKKNLRKSPCWFWYILIVLLYYIQHS